MTSRTMCILFSESYENNNNELAASRTLATIPFCGRYCLIDFVLSSLVKAGVHNIGVLTKDYYGSLVDHLGWGKDWDLDRKNGGLKVLTPFAKENTVNTRNRSRVDALLSCLAYIESCPEKYIILADSNLVMNIDFEAMVDYHIEKQADITVLYHKQNQVHFKGVDLSCDREGYVTDAVFLDGRAYDTENQLLNVYVFDKALLLELLNRAYTFGWSSFIRDFITRNINRLKVAGFEHKGFCAVIDTVADYYSASMEVIKPENQKDLFRSGTMILTNVQNTAPAVHGFDSKVKNSLIADGCHIDGELENCIIFRNVTVEKGAVLKNSIIFPQSVVKEGAMLDCVIADKNVTIEKGHRLSGYATYPMVVAKESSV